MPDWKYKYVPSALLEWKDSNQPSLFLHDDMCVLCKKPKTTS